MFLFHTEVPGTAATTTFLPKSWTAHYINVMIDCLGTIFFFPHFLRRTVSESCTIMWHRFWKCACVCIFRIQNPSRRNNVELRNNKFHFFLDGKALNVFSLEMYSGQSVLSIHFNYQAFSPGAASCSKWCKEQTGPGGQWPERCRWQQPVPCLWGWSLWKGGVPDSHVHHLKSMRKTGEKDKCWSNPADWWEK